LKKRKEKLAEIRNFYKPFDKEEMIEHNKKYQTLKKAKNYIINENRMKEKAEIA
jgi:hypothetical protein